MALAELDRMASRLDLPKSIREAAAVNYKKAVEARLIRDSVVVYQGKIISVRRFKEDVKEVLQGYECGLSLENFQDIKQGDVVEPFIMEEISR